MSRTVPGLRLFALGVLVFFAVALRLGPTLFAGATPAAATVSRSKEQAAETVPFRVSVPRTLGLWTGQTVALEERAPQILETDDIAVMEYHLGLEPPVWFTQVGGFGTRAAFHPPELCYVGNSFQVVERGPITVMVRGIPRRLMRVVVGRDHQRFEAWYWFTANGRMTPSYYQQQLWFVMDAIHGKSLAGTLVRIATPLDEPDAARRRLLAFLTSFETIQVARL